MICFVWTSSRLKYNLGSWGPPSVKFWLIRVSLCVPCSAVSSYGNMSKRTTLLAPGTSFPKPHGDASEPPVSPHGISALDDIHNSCRLLLSQFGPEVAFPAQAQMLPFLSWSEEFSWRLSLFVNGLGRLHPGSFFLGFLQIAPPLQVEMGPQLWVVTHRMCVPSASRGVEERNTQREASLYLKSHTTSHSCPPWQPCSWDKSQILVFQFPTVLVTEWS